MDVCDRFTAVDIDVSDVEVLVSQGEVTLSGSVDDRWAKFELEEIADEVSGVKEVRNDIRVHHARFDEGQERGGEPRPSGNGGKRSVGPH